MSTADHPEKGRPDGEATLGDLLYADKTAVTVPEREWVELVRSIADGNQRALRALYERTNRIVFTLSVRIVNDRQTAEEVTLDVFHDVWRRAQSYDPAGGPVIGWIMNLARSRAIDRLRFEQRKKRVSRQGDGPAEPQEGPHGAFDVREQGRVLRSALDELTADERRAIEMAYFSELTYAEVATRLEQPLGTIKTRIRSGLAKLRESLGPRLREP